MDRDVILTTTGFLHSNGVLALPDYMCEAIGLRPSDMLEIFIEPDRILLEKRPYIRRNPRKPAKKKD